MGTWEPYRRLRRSSVFDRKGDRLMATIATSATRASRPGTVTVAVALTVGATLASLPVFFLPGADEVPGAVVVFSIIAGVVTLVGAWGMWNLRRWGAILTFVLTALNTLSSLPGLLEPPSGWIVG